MTCVVLGFLQIWDEKTRTCLVGNSHEIDPVLMFLTRCSSNGWALIYASHFPGLHTGYIEDLKMAFFSHED